MRKIEYSIAFKKDWKRETKGKYRSSLNQRFKHIVSLLIQDGQLGRKYRDHELVGDWHGYRECHVWPDLLLIYKLSGQDSLRLARIGSHSKLFK